MKTKLIRLLIRLLGFIPILILISINCINLFFTLMINYLKYGSELIIRNETLKTSDIKAILYKLKESENEVLFKYYDEVCKLAEEKMLESGKLEGMHYSAMKEILKKYQN